MSKIRAFRTTLVLLLLAAAVSGAVSAAGAQAYNYPALQTPVLVEREYNFAAASASRAGTSLLVQWREALSPGWQSTLEGGLGAPPNEAARLILGGTIAWQAKRSKDDFPLDVALTAGLGLSIAGGNSVLRLPVGAVVGHTFDLQDGFRITPFVHPRLSIDRCSECRERRLPDGKLSVDVDVGADFLLTPQISLRVAALLGGSAYVGGSSSVGLSLAWTPKGLRK